VAEHLETQEDIKIFLKDVFQGVSISANREYDTDTNDNLLTFVTEETTIFRRVSFRESHVFRVVAFDAEFSCCLSFHAKEPVVVVIVGDFGCAFFRGSHKKGQQCYG